MHRTAVSYHFEVRNMKTSYEAGLRSSRRFYRRIGSFPLLGFRGCLYSLAHDFFQQCCYSDFCFYFCSCLVSKSCLTLFETPMDCSRASSSVHGISQARILELVDILFSRVSYCPRPRVRTCFSCIGK